MVHAFLTVLALAAGPETLIADPVLTLRSGVRSTPRVASNGTGYLIVWADAGEIRVARVDSEGRVLDPAGIRVAVNSGGGPAVASDGHDYVVAYNCNPGSGYALDPSVCLAHVEAATGKVEQGARLSGARNPAIASARGRYLVAFQNPYANSITNQFFDVVEVNADASAGGAPIRMGSSPYPPDVASNGQDYFVVWSTYRQLKGILLRGGLEQTFTPAPASWGPSAFAWSVASNGDGFMVVWQHNAGVADNRYVTELRASSVSAAGAARPSRVVSSSLQTAWSPQVAWDGAKYVVTYTFAPERPTSPGLTDRSATDVHEFALNADAEVVMPQTMLAVREGSEAYSSAASNGTSTLIAWENLLRSDAARIETAFFRTAGAPATPFTIPISVAWQQNVAAASGNGEVRVAWEEILGEDQKRTVFVQRMRGGKPLDGRGVPVGSSPRHQVFPAISRSFVAWTEHDLKAVGGQTGAAFAKRGDEVLRLGNANRDAHIAIAETATTALAVWQSPSRQIVGVRIQQNGVVDAEPFVISGDQAARNPVIATDGESFLVAWEKEEPCYLECLAPFASLYAAGVTSSGVVAPPAKLADLPVSSASAVWNGGEYVVFWNQGAFGIGKPYGFMARRLDRSGLPLGANIGIREDVFANAVAWNGREYLAAVTGSPGFAPIAAARFDRDLHLIDSTGFSGAYVANTRVALLPDWIGYQLKDFDGVSRAVSRTLDSAVPGKRRAVR